LKRNSTNLKLKMLKNSRTKFSTLLMMKRKKLINGNLFLEIRCHGIKFLLKDRQPDLLSTKLSFGAAINTVIMDTMDIMIIIDNKDKSQEKRMMMKIILWNQSTKRSLRSTHTKHGLIISHTLKKL